MLTIEKILALRSQSSNVKHEKLYALIDHSGAPGLVENLKRLNIAWLSLFSGEQNAGALEVAPILFEIASRETWNEKAILKWICNNCSFTSVVIIMTSPLSMKELASRLSTRLDARLSGPVDIILRYYDARIFEALVKILSPEQRVGFLNPATAWWYIDREGEPKFVQSTFCLVEDLTAPLEFDEAQENALVYESEPDRIAHLLRETVPVEFGKLTAAHGNDFIKKNIATAKFWNLTSTRDVATYCALGLVYGEDFGQLKQWREALAEVKSGRLTLKSAIALVDTDEEIYE